MITRIAEIIYEWMGWCPNAQPKIYPVVIRPYDNAAVPAAGGSFKDRANHWLGLFRNQILLFALFMSATGFWLYADLGGWLYLPLFICGIITGFLVSVFVGIWYRQIFNEVLQDGPVVLWNRYDKISGTIALVISLVFECLTIGAILGGIPGISLEMINTLFGGFIAIVFWGQFASIRKWELENCKTLRYDGMILELEKEEKHAFC